MSRMGRIVNYTCTLANTWYKVFDESDYRNNRVKEVKVKLREDSTASFFRYNYDGSTTVFMTSTSGWTVVKDVKKLYCYIPTTAAQVVEIEVIYE